MPENSTYLDFLNVFLEIDSIFFDYEIKYLSNRQDAAKYLGTTNDVKEIIKQVYLLKKYH